jgi:hypothetical protein
MPPRRRIEGICPYCGRTKRLTGEHVIPDTLFRVADPNMAVVYICHQCNNGMSAGIRDLRNLLALHLGSSSHPDIEHHLLAMYETNENTRNWIKRTIENAEPVDYVSDEGVILGTVLRFDFHKERALRALTQVVRGLYLVETGGKLGIDTRISVAEIFLGAAPTFVQNLTRYQHGEPVHKGNDVVTWVPFTEVDDADPESSAWILIFFSGVCFVGGTGSLAKSIAKFWQTSLHNEIDLPRIDGRLQAKTPRLPDGSYWTPPGGFGEYLPNV